MLVNTEDVGKLRPYMRHSTAKRYIKNKSRLNEEKENAGIRCNEPATNLDTMTSSCSMQQQHTEQQQQQRRRQQHSLCIYTDFSIAQTTPESSSYIPYTSGNKIHGANNEIKSENGTRKKKAAIRDSNHRRLASGDRDLPAIPLYFLHFVYIDRYWYVPVPTNRRLGYFEQKTKTPPVGARRREHGRSRPRQSRERRAMRGTSSKHHTEWWTSSRAMMKRLRLKTWSKY